MLGGSLIWSTSYSCWPTGSAAFTICCLNGKASHRIGPIRIRKVISLRWPVNISARSTGPLLHSLQSAICPLRRPTQSELPFDSIFLISFFFSFLCYRPIYFWNRLFFKIWSTIVNSPLGEKTSFLRYWKRERKISWLWSTLLFFSFWFDEIVEIKKEKILIKISKKRKAEQMVVCQNLS